MMLRSSSTPILGSLLSSYSESPNHNHHSEFNSPKHIPKRWSFHHTQAGHLHVTSPSSHSFNSSPSVNPDLLSNDRDSGQKTGFRRAQSEGNLEGLLSDSCNKVDELSHSMLSRKFPRKPGCAVLQTIPSISVYNPRYNESDNEEDEYEEEESGDEETMKVQSGNQKMSMKMGSEDLSMEFINNMRLNVSNVLVQENDNVLSKMHLAKGLGAISGGFNGGGGGGHHEHKTRDFGGEGDDEVSMEEYYKKMVEGNPGNPLFLRNYAQFLHQSKKDLGRAEEYYSRAILADPGDGEILSQYAQVTWELHGDEDRVSSYFERAVQASPEDSHVLGAYAGFLWETEEAEDDHCTIPTLLHDNVIAAATAY